MSEKQATDPTVQNAASDGLDARRASLDIIGLIARGRSLDEALRDCRSFDALAGADRAFARALATAALRRRGSIDHIIGAYIDRPLPPKAARVMNILRLATAQLLLLETPPHAAVSTAVALTREFRETGGYAGLVNAVARKIAKTGPATLAKLPARTDTPGWLWRSWERAYGPAAARAIAEAHQKIAPLDLTVKDPAQAESLADNLGAELLPTGSLRLAGGDVQNLPGYEDGAWWVQDAAAALPARLLGDVSGKRVFDLCAAPGGKTLQLAAAGAHVISVDKSAIRLARLSENLARTGLSAEAVCNDVLQWEPKEPADMLLLDAPCSATGTIRRHPDIPWTKSEADIKGLAELQDKMIARAKAFLKPGGVLIYCVCSLQKEEGEDRAEEALARHQDLARVPVDPSEIGGLKEAVNRYGDLRTLPSMIRDKGGLDGFFAARFRLAAD